VGTTPLWGLAFQLDRLSGQSGSRNGEIHTSSSLNHRRPLVGCTHTASRTGEFRDFTAVRWVQLCHQHLSCRRSALSRALRLSVVIPAGATTAAHAEPEDLGLWNLEITSPQHFCPDVQPPINKYSASTCSPRARLPDKLLVGLAVVVLGRAKLGCWLRRKTEEVGRTIDISPRASKASIYTVSGSGCWSLRRKGAVNMCPMAIFMRAAASVMLHCLDAGTKRHLLIPVKPWQEIVEAKSTPRVFEREHVTLWIWLPPVTIEGKVPSQPEQSFTISGLLHCIDRDGRRGPLPHRSSFRSSGTSRTRTG
jgi:hypothetical protein